ncbi:photosystem II reaction center W protein, chloroplastic [Physcomitrium patens]|uniref:PSII 6.1 kDa protein n=1 Tax=Physcomitrium patens TaxID=3218 RepID=A0A2K1INP0_PHYPA|nr:photosystem II reaction center W protein, chloroplastic-like [Physcomitrium patens]XP_024361086.1 photosystem II reaction center W protein, chloroplastic-like [Physcomitrium patens]PNR30896.1 hypothetical protein PHYPA_027212 [Physcomitrium patens]PNR30898.1 hypothetical protein PHYPA_027214 [Physcomitrium patens]|eukprot:XP_024361057.1 photosystem II reaction center W protein, chloroplastic-like [Physcomitrella patens]
MAAVACTSCASPATCLVQKSLGTSSSHRAAARPVAGVPVLAMPRIVCSLEKKESNKGDVNGLPQLAAAVTSAATMAYAHPVFALVDERLSTEGTGLGLGVSNPKLTWILVGVTALVWAVYFTYSSTLPEGDDDSGLSL